jgi:hypothetical protein
MNISISKSLGLVASGLVLCMPMQANAANGDVVARGSLAGANGHVTKGKVMVVEMDGGYVVKLSEGFSLDGAPDPKLAFGVGGEAPLILSALKSNTGAQTYDVPAGVDPANFNKFYIWCEQYSVSLGDTELK